MTIERVLEEGRQYLTLPPAKPVPVAQTDNLTPPTNEQSLSPVLRLQQQRRELGIETKTIRRLLRDGEFPERKAPHRRPPKVHDFAEYLEQHWTEGCQQRYEALR
jgi:hypothetical protein